MRLNLYRRHRGKCEAGRGRNFMSSELDERRKDWGRRCECEIVMAGVLGREFRRKSTGTWEWDKAQQVAEVFEKADSWTGEAKAVVPVEPVEQPPQRVTFVDAGKIFLTSRESKQPAAATLRKYKTFVKQLKGYAEAKGYVFVDQFTPTDADLFYASLKLGSRAKGKRLGTLRAFFRFAVNRKWIKETPVSEDIKPPVGSSTAADKMPFSDEEIERIIAACDKPPRPRATNGPKINEADYVGVIWTNHHGDGVWTGEDVKDIVWLMLYTGYRISDATFFDMSRLQGNEVIIRALKNGEFVFGVLPDFVLERLKARAKIHGNRPFIIGTSTRVETVTNLWRRRLAMAFRAAGEFEHTPTPHRFRHSFARMLLEKGVSVADVAELMGDDEETIRKHYSRWIRSRQVRLSNVLTEALIDKPRPKLVGIQGGRP